MDLALLTDRIDRHVDAVRQLAGEAPAVQAICELLIETFKAGRRLFLAGPRGRSARGATELGVGEGWRTGLRDLPPSRP